MAFWVWSGSPAVVAWVNGTAHEEADLSDDTGIELASDTETELPDGGYCMVDPGGNGRRT